MKGFHDLIETLDKRFKLPLPGKPSQFKMAGQHRMEEALHSSIPPDARKAGVLLLLYPANGEASMVFIQRHEYEGVHSGQISLPGGERETRDKTIVDTAIREAWEETGIDPGTLHILGSLTDLYIPPSNFHVVPVVGYSNNRPDFKADPSEVEKILEVEVRRLRSKDVVQNRRIRLSQGFSLTAPAFVIGDTIIWGATAMIVSEFLDMLTPELNRGS